MNRLTKTLLGGILLLLLLLGYVLVREDYPQRIIRKLNKPKEPNGQWGKPSGYAMNRQELFEVLPKDSNSILFLGNSLTSYFELAELFQNLNVKNRGISGDDIPGLLNRLGPIIETRPRKIFIEIGVNDLEEGYPVEIVIRNYQRLLDTLQLKCTASKIYVQSLFPVSNIGQMPVRKIPPKRDKLNESIKEVNKALKDCASSLNITFVDLYDKFVLDGEMNIKYTIEGEHFSGAGYLLWTELLRPYVEE